MFTISCFTFNPIAENSYVLSNGAKDSIIIDPGCYFPNERERIADYITQNGLLPKYLLNTHCHLDHVFGNSFIHQTYDLDLYVHSNEKVVLENAPMAGLLWNLPFENYKGPLHFLRENETIGLGEDALKVLFTPGHSPGHVCFYSAKQHFVIGGDALFKMSIGRTDLPGGDYPTLINSIRSKLLALPDETVVYSGHGESTTIGFERRNNPFLQ